MVENYQINRNHRVSENVDYDEFFHPNICHICKATDQEILITCMHCGLISYCSENHRYFHESYHSDICIIIKNVITEDPHFSCLNEQWFEYQRSIMLKVQMMLPRELKPYEKQMFMHTRSCFTCHREDDLNTCKRCISFEFCNEHKLSAALHESICRQIVLSLNLDIKYLEKEEWDTLYIRALSFPDGRPVTNIDDFCKRYYRKLNTFEGWGLNHYIFTDYVSDPLTLYTGLKLVELYDLIKLTNTFVIHIIGANYINRRNFPAWELFLHTLINKTKLIIVMIGPTLKHETGEHEVCIRCKFTKKRLILQSFPFFYHNYIFNREYTLPNVIIGFQVNLNKNTWIDSIKVIQKQDCPLFLASYSEYTSILNITEIRRILGIFISPNFKDQNNFNSRRPFRNKYHDVSFRNSYLIIYKNLNIQKSHT